mgnify:CR=1 FL=1
MQKVRFGFIGAGSIAKKALYPALKNSQFGEIYAVAGKDAERAKSLSPSGKFYTDYQELIDDPNVEAVYISLPNSLHIPWSIKAMQAGKHVLCEKSSTVSYDSAKRMVSAAKQNNVRLMEGFMFRFHPQHQKVIELINDHMLGDLFLFTGNYGFPPVSHDNIRYNRDLGGGILNETGCYPIYASRMIFDDEPVSVMCDLFFDNSYKIDMKGHASIFFADERMATVSFSFDSYYQANYKIWGKTGLIEVNRAYAIPPDLATKVHLQIGNEKKELEIGPADHFSIMIDSFSKEIANLEKAGFNFEQDLLYQARLMEALRLADKSKKRIFLSDIQ